MVATNPYLSVNAVNLSTYLRNVDPSGIGEVEQKDATVASSTGVKRVEAGLEGWSIKATFKQVFGAGYVHETLRAAHKTIVAIEFRFDGAAVGATNPKVTGNALVLYKPKLGQVGEFLEAEVELIGDGAYTWATS